MSYQKTRKTRFFIVSGYGVVDLFLRSDDEMLGLQNYYGGLWHLMLEKLNSQSDLIHVIFTGVFTNPNCVTSEAESARQYFLEMFSEGIDLSRIRFSVEEESTSTTENLVYGFLIAQKSQKLPIKNFTIVCDNSRRGKVRILAWNLFSKKVEVEVQAYERIDTNLKSNYLLQTLSGILEILFSKRYHKLKSLLHSKMNW